MSKQTVYRLIILLGLLPTIGVFAWGIRTATLTKSVEFVRPFSSMK